MNVNSCFKYIYKKCQTVFVYMHATYSFETKIKMEYQNMSEKFNSTWNFIDKNLSCTDCLWNDSHGVVLDEELAAKVYWALVLIPLPLVAVVGNILVILSVYKERSLQSATNYFIVSLAFADLLVAAVVMPFAVYVLVRYFSCNSILLVIKYCQ